MSTESGCETSAAPHYDRIALPYQRSKQSPICCYIERYSLFRMLGDISEQSVLDLACGDGIYSRQMIQRGAHRVKGIDISPAMIRLARADETDLSSIEYQVADAQNLPDDGLFDVVCAAYLLHYSRDIGELERMCHNIAGQLKPGGRLVAINENPNQVVERYSGYLQYGFSKKVTLPRCEGSAINYVTINGREIFRIKNYHFERSTYERLLEEAGLVDVCWHALELDPEGEQLMGSEYWAEYLDNPPVIGLTCKLPDCGEV